MVAPTKRSRVIQKLILLWRILKRKDGDGRKKWSWFRLSWRFLLQLAINDCSLTIVGKSEQWMESSNVSSNCGWYWNGMQDVISFQRYLPTWRVKSRDCWMKEVMSKHLIRGLRRFMCVNHWRGSRVEMNYIDAMKIKSHQKEVSHLFAWLCDFVLLT